MAKDGRDIFYMASVGDLNGVKEMLDGRPQHRRMDINAADANGMQSVRINRRNPC
jgi:hypothetical protein